MTRNSGKVLDSKLESNHNIMFNISSKKFKTMQKCLLIGLFILCFKIQHNFVSAVDDGMETTTFFGKLCKIVLSQKFQIKFLLIEFIMQKFNVKLYIMTSRKENC
jgi:hypothetical protein